MGSSGDSISNTRLVVSIEQLGETLRIHLPFHASQRRVAQALHSLGYALAREMEGGLPIDTALAVLDTAEATLRGISRIAHNRTDIKCPKCGKPWLFCPGACVHLDHPNWRPGCDCVEDATRTQSTPKPAVEGEQ